jgi:hypothetical protein
MKKALFFILPVISFLALFSLTNISNAQVAQRWLVRYNGLGNGEDDATSMTIDAADNIYVTGASTGIGTGLDYTTIKYNASGALQWVARYNGIGNGTDFSQSIAVDGSGNVYVTGSSTGIGTGLDYATIKYNASGVQQWAARYNGPGNGLEMALSVTVDGSGNVFVTGYSAGNGTNYDYATLKYNSAGVQQWVARYNGPANDVDIAYSVIVDGSGNVYTTGASIGSGTSGDYATIKYNSSGIQQWAVRYNGPGNGNDEAYCIILDGSGNCYVTGYSKGSGSSGLDYETIKYNPSGLVQWAQRYNGPGDSSDIAYALTRDVSDNIFVTGESFGSTSNYDYATIKYNSTGVQQWIARYNGPGNSSDCANAIAADYSGNVYVTGRSTGVGTGIDYSTVKYSFSGVQTWVQRYNSSNGSDEAKSIAVDDYGGVFVTGQSFGNNIDYCTIGYIQTPPPPALISPPNNSTGITLTPVLDWSDVPTANTYRVQVSTSSGFGSFVINQRVLNFSVYQVQENALQNSTQYYWRVRDSNAVGASSWSSVWNFTTTPIGIKPISSHIPNDYRLYHNYPNPFNPSTIIIFDLPKPGYVGLSVYDILGKELKVLVSEKLNAGSYKVDWNADKYPSGVYFYKLHTESFSDTKKMVLLK